jgi:hypothetical protein
MNKTSIILVLIVVAGLGFFAWKNAPVAQAPTIEEPVVTEEIKTYADPDGSFTFTYPADFMVAGRQAEPTTNWRINTDRRGIVLAKATLPSSFDPNTNFSEGVLTIGWSNSPVAIQKCTVAENSEEEMSIVDINGLKFQKFHSLNAGAGNLYDTTGYRAILDGDCYSLEYTIHSTNIANYDPGRGIHEFDKEKVTKALEDVVKSFHFLVNSD